MVVSLSSVLTEMPVSKLMLKYTSPGMAHSMDLPLNRVEVIASELGLENTVPCVSHIMAL